MNSDPTAANLAYLPLVPVSLTDEQWDDVVRSSNLPPEARPLVGRAIAMYRAMEGTRSASGSASTRALLEDLSRHASQLHELMTTVLNNPRAILALTLALYPRQDFGRSMGKKLVDKNIRKKIADIERLANWFSTAVMRVAKGGPGARQRAFQIQMLIIALDKILEQFKKQRINRSGKGTATSRDYITAVCAIADQTIGSSSIEEAMKRLIKTRGKFSS